MVHIAKRACFALAAGLTLTAMAAAQSDKTDGGSLDSAAVSVEAENENLRPPRESPVSDLLNTPKLLAQTEHFRQEREALADDPLRPLYHFSRSKGLLHDPTGLCWWQGKYHLFYLARGHAVSDDLVHWQDLPLMPTFTVGFDR